MADILREIIGGRDVLSMRVSEAQEVVAEFYMRVELLTLGRREEFHTEYACKRVLEHYGLGFLAE